MILGGSSKNAIPLPLGAASRLLATQHTYFKKSIFFVFLGNLGCLVRIGFYNGLWRGRQCVGVVTRSRAYMYCIHILCVLDLPPYTVTVAFLRLKKGCRKPGGDYDWLGGRSNIHILGGGFKYFIFTPIWGRFPFWLILLKGVETTN